MNNLSLRVSSIRVNDSLKKHSEIKTDIFKVPSCIYQPENKYISALVQAASVDEQIKVLKEYSAYILCIEKSLLSNIQTLAELFIEAPLKHAVKNALIRLLSQIDVSKEIVVLGLSNTIRKKIQNYDKHQNTLASRNALINGIGSCFENFKVGIDAIRCCLQDILCFFNKSLVLYIEQISQDISPSDKSEISLFIHSTVRVVISCFNQFPTQVKNTYEGEKNVEKLILICWDLLENPEIPMDTKINCGILITINANLEKRYLRLTERVFLEENSTKKLCLLNGIICTIESDLFSEPDYKGFKIFAQTAITLKEISEENSIEPSIILGVSRSFLQMTKKLLSLQKVEYSKMDQRELIEVLTINLGYSLSHLDHYMDSVRHLCKEILRLTIQLGVKVNDTLNHIIYDYIRNISININTKCILIGAICSIVQSKAVMKAVPNVINFLLKSLTVNDHANINLNINNCYETLMMYDKYEENKQEWFNKWINPILLEINNNENNADIKQILFDLIRKAIKSYPDIAIRMIESKTTTNFGLILASLGIAKKTGLFDKFHSNDIKWKNLIPYNDIKLAMISADDSTRMSALHLITESHKSTELFTNKDLECILFFLETNINVQAPSLRQKITSYMKNALNRLKSGFLSIIKKSDIDGKSHYYYEFVKKLHNFCIDNLFVGANYSRRTISFQILIQLLQIASYIFYDDKTTNMWNEQHIQTLLNSLDDTYEANKVYCMSVLVYCPKDYIRNFNNLINYDVAKELMISIKPNDTLSAAYYLEYLCFINSSIEPPPVTDEPLSSIHPKVHNTLLWCEQILQQSLDLAKTSLLRAVRENPIFGSLACIRHLLSKVDLNEVSKCYYWAKFITKLVMTCRELTEVVSIVVNSASPEGHLPNDFSSIENYGFDEDVEMQSIGTPSALENIDETNNFSKTTPQMVLLCAWRTVKEVSLILGDIVFRSPIIKTQHFIVSETPKDYSYFLCSEQIIEIGSIFTQLLSETKHRGAFEQAYVGFSKLCVRLWSSQLSNLHQLPMKWLQEMIHIINNESSAVNSNVGFNPNKICSTRRSAGIPYMIQALITSELQMNSSKGLQFTMKKLIELCQTGPTAVTRTHSLNILRALFRSTELGETIGEFVSDGIECAINGYDAECWSERNSSTLLLSALMIRIFGVQRTKDSENLNIRNKMTGRIFFLRYPQLYDFFIKELENASQIIKSGSRSKKLHPLLLLLSRLYPSALEGSESNLKLSRFVPIVSICSGCAELQTRYLAAKFIAIIVSPDLVFDRIFLLLESLNRSNNKTINPNSLHGALLQILYLIKTRTLGAIPETSNQLNNWMELYTAISNYLFEMKPNYILYGTIIDILIEILARCQNFIFTEDEQFLDDLSNIVDYLFNLSKQKTLYGNELIIRKLVLIKVVMYIHNEDENLQGSCFLSDIDPAKYKYDYLEAVMNIILLTLDLKEFSSNAEQFDIDRMEIFYIRYLSSYKPTKLKALQNEFMKSLQFHTFLKQIIDGNLHYNCTVKAFTILSYSIVGVQTVVIRSSCRETVNYMFNLAKHKPNQMKACIYKCIKCIYSVEMMKNTDSTIDVDVLPMMASAEQCGDVRFIAMQILEITSRFFMESKSLEFLLRYSKALLILLRDDECNIREGASLIVKRIYNLTTGLNTKAVISSYAQRIFLSTLSKTMLSKEIPMIEVIAVLYILMSCDLEETDSCSSEKSEIRVFDRSEVNIYGEPLILREFCIAEIQSLIAEHNIHIDSNADNIIQVAERLSGVKFDNLVYDIQQSARLVNILGDKQHLLK